MARRGRLRRVRPRLSANRRARQRLNPKQRAAARMRAHTRRRKGR